VSLADTRERHVQARKLLAAGVDPGKNRKATKAARAESAESAANNFAVLSREWLALRTQEWVAGHRVKQAARLANRR